MMEFSYRFSVVVILAIMSLSVSSKISEPLYKYYMVEGSDFNSLDVSIKSNRPRGFNSMNETHIGWQFNFKHLKGKCYLINPIVTNKVIITLPKWLNQQGASAKLANEWRRYIKALKTHQLGHVSFSYKAQKAILSDLKHIKPEKKCSIVKIKANQSAKEILKYFNLQDKKYEKNTKKGFAQGAVLHQL